MQPHAVSDMGSYSCSIHCADGSSSSVWGLSPSATAMVAITPRQGGGSDAGSAGGSGKMPAIDMTTWLGCVCVHVHSCRC